MPVFKAFLHGQIWNCVKNLSEMRATGRGFTFMFVVAIIGFLMGVDVGTRA